MELQVHMWPNAVLLCLLGLLLQPDVGQAQRMVTIQSGPLYRVKGFHVSITCTVSGFQGPDEQTFHFSAYRPSRPSQEIQIISTADKMYSYAVYSSRVHSGDIWIERLSGSSVVFHINNALLEDTAEIECHTPNTDIRYFGTYSAKTSLHVVEDTLLATYSGPSSVDLFEGDTLQLECLASSQTFQHTHLSITWLLHGDADAKPRPIIILDRDLTVRPGEGYDTRYQSRQVSIEKVEETQYRLRMTQVQQADQGRIFCRVQEWVQDPDRTWFNIASRDAQAVDVVIKTVEVAEDSFATRIKVTDANLQEGKTVEVRCSVEAQNLPELFFTVAWFKGDQEVARLGPLGLLTVGPRYSGRATEGELWAVKTTEKDYLLTLRPARAEDQGGYQCRVWQEKRGDKGGFTQGQLQRSNSQQVTITAKESGLRVSMVPNLSATEGAPLTLSCSLSEVHGELSVTWEHKKDTPGSVFSEVIHLSQDGVTKLAPQYQQRALRTFRSTNVTVLEMGGAEEGDRGIYRCTVSEWSRDTSGGMKKVASQSQQCSVAVKSLDTLVRAVLISRTVNVTVNDMIYLKCIVRGPKVPLSVRWMFKQTGSTSEEMVVSVLHTGNVAWERDRDGYQLSADVGEDRSEYNLEVNKASLRNSGIYQCHVGVYLNHTQKASKSSNPLGVQVNKPVSKLSLTTDPTSTLRTIINSDIQLSCTVATATSNSSRFGITWEVDGRTIASGNRDGIVTLPDAGKRTSVITLPGPIFRLELRQVGSSDSGRYLCKVEEWLQDTAGEWYSLPPQSASVQVVVNEKPSDFRMDQTLIETKGREGEQIDISCRILSGKDDPSSHFALTWLFQRNSPDPGSANTITLLTYTQQADLTYRDSPASLQNRLRFSRPDPGTFLLTVDNAELDDSGKFWCTVEQYQHNCHGKWEKKGSQRSGDTQVTVNPIEATLHLQKTNRAMTVTDQQNGFKVECLVQSRSSDRSVFDVIWSRTQITQDQERTQVVFKASRDGTLNAMDSGLMFDRPTATHFSLTFPTTGPSDWGSYSCQVTEWLQMPGDRWRKLAEDKSGELTVTIQTKGKSTFSMSNATKKVEVKEGQRLDLDCSVASEGSNPSSSSYTITWLFQRRDSEAYVALLTQDHNGRLTLPGSDNRLRLSRPARNTFGLVILNAVPEDSGAYTCKVELHQYDCSSQWKAVAFGESGLITVNVHGLEANLHVKKDDHHLNVTELKDSFKVDCIITSQSSEESLFEVTWFRSWGNNQRVPIFKIMRNGTLQDFDNVRTGLVFARPKVTSFILTVPQAVDSDSGQYSCKVVEWVRTPTNTWKKMAEDQSGFLNLQVYTAAISQAEVSAHEVMTPVFAILILILVVVVAILAWKMHQAKVAQKKRQESLWAESNPLKPSPEAL
ncbi:hypothetical protein ACEWY4_022913 [Coilia grayii]|uniref:Ig-like domain-containing protein n=1 Tax=Coilia grayii TaxID=363190 RepID=A0ABD1J440_9TELE